MKLIMFCHPLFLPSQSMPRFARMLQSAFQDRGYQVELWAPRARFYTWLRGTRLAKWGGYIDQYILFPFWVRNALKSVPSNTLFVFCDQALGPWVPLVRRRPHVVHVHDLLALRSALGDVPENRTSLTGRIYQRYIRHGYRQARHFISISQNTRDDLTRFGQVDPITSEVVYNGMNYPFTRLPEADARNILIAAGLLVPVQGMVIHIGGGQWYKNLSGVIAMYAQYAARTATPLPLWLITAPPNATILAAISKIAYPGKVVLLSSINTSVLQAIYSLGQLLLFPSLAEGFGWPIVEALACGCPVITTDAPPMTEVGADAVDYLPRLSTARDREEWALGGALKMLEVLGRTMEERQQRCRHGMLWAQRFDTDRSITQYLAIYDSIAQRPEFCDAIRPGNAA